MKKIVNVLFASAVAALALVSCQKNQETDFTPAGPAVKFHAAEVATKTTFGTPENNVLPTLWTANEQVSISLNKATAVKADVTPSSDGKTADFTPASAIVDDESGAYKFYALSPSSAVISSISNGYNSWSLDIPTEQNPSSTSVDETAQILASTFDAGTTFPESVTFQFSHIAAYGKIFLTNLNLDEGETLSSVTLAAAKKWAGRWYYYAEDSEKNSYKAGDWAENGSNGSNIITINTTDADNIWFACVPVDLGGKTIDVSVSTSKNRIFKKTITIPEGKKFEAGKVAQFGINRAYINPSETKTYVLIKDVTELVDGEEIIIVSPKDDFALGTGSGTFRPAVAIERSENADGKSIIVNPSSAVQTISLCDDGPFGFDVGGAYLCAVSSDKNYIGTNEKLIDEAYWDITITDGIAQVTARGQWTRNSLRYNKNDARFSCYGSTSTQSHVQIYMLDGKGNEPANVDTHGLSADDPFTASEAIEFIKNLTSTPTTAVYYVKGIISRIQSEYSTKYGDATFFISDDGSADSDEFEAYSVLYLDNKAWEEGDEQIGVGDEVVVCGQLTIYKGQAETYADNKATPKVKGYLVSLKKRPLVHGVTVDPSVVVLGAAIHSRKDVSVTCDYETDFEYTSNNKFTVSWITAEVGKKLVVTALNDGGSEEVTLGTIRVFEKDNTNYYTEITVKQSPEGTVNETTISKTMVQVSSENGWTASSGNDNVVCYKSFSLDNVITVSTSGDNNCGSYWSNGNDWRLYQNKGGDITISASSGHTIVSAKITYSVQNTGTLKSGSTVIASGDTQTVNASSVTYVVGNTNSSVTNGQVRVTVIEVTYK